MPRAFHIPGIIFLFCAFVLLFLVSISLPFLTALDFARVHFNEGTPTVGTDTNPIKELRVSPGCDGNFECVIERGADFDFSIFVCRLSLEPGESLDGKNFVLQCTELTVPLRGNCAYEVGGNRVCTPSGNAYATTIYDAQRQAFVNIGPSWTRGLAIHPVGESSTHVICAFGLNRSSSAATGVTLVAFLLSLSSHVTVTLLASLASFLAALLALIAFAVDIALYAFVKHEVHKLSGVASNTNTAPGELPSRCLRSLFSFLSSFLALLSCLHMPLQTVHVVVGGCVRQSGIAGVRVCSRFINLAVFFGWTFNRSR